MSGQPVPGDRTLGIEALVARVLHVGTLVAMAMLVVGVVLTLGAGTDPLTAAPAPFDAARLVPDVLALRAAGFLWLGIVLVIALPVGRVVLELAGAAAQRDRTMVVIAGGILVIVGVAIVFALA